MRCYAVLPSLAVCLVVAARAADPPRPNLEKPVDYIKWVNEEFGKDIQDNAADGYQKAAAALGPDDDALRALLDTDSAKWSMEQRKKLRENLQAKEAALQLFVAATERKSCFFLAKSESGTLLGWTLADFPRLRSACRLLAARARLKLLDGDASGATDDVVAMLHFSQHMYHQPPIVSYLIGLAVSSVAYDVLIDVPRLCTKPFDSDALIARLETEDKPPPRPLRQIEFEEAATWDGLQRSLKDTDGDGRCDVMVGPLVHDLGGGAERLPVEPPQPFNAIIDESAAYYARVREIFVEDYAEARRRNDAIDKETEARSKTAVGIFTPSLTATAVVQRRVIALRHAARVVLGLHAYRAKHGQWPSDLKDALTGKSARLIVDPFSNKPFIYKVRDVGPLLYSVSGNGVDDNGEIFRKNGKPAFGDTGDWIFWPAPE